MCPSFRLTHDERDSPRGRANSIRMAVGGELGADALASDHMARTMSLCTGCKGCRSECPRGVDIAQAKIIARSERIRKHGMSRFERSIAELPDRAMRYRRWRHILNLRDVVPWAGRFSQRLTGIAADRPWPHLSSDPFRVYKPSSEGENGEIVIFPDTFNNYFDGVTLKSTENILSASGFRSTILVPPPGERPYCCGRTYLEVGLLDEARSEASRLIEAMRPFTERGIPLVGVEPACILTIRDEMKTMLALDGAADLARNALLFEEAMSLPGVADTIRPRLREIEGEAFIASHCHQQSFRTDRKAQGVASYVSSLEFVDVTPGCCGMGTSFGYDPETVDVSLRMGEMSLFPQIRKTSRDTLLIADGYGCRKQIRDGTGRTARHTAVLLKLALDAKERFGAAYEGTRKPNRRLEKRLTRLKKSYFKY
jgi:Fe-S oxidoreductase